MVNKSHHQHFISMLLVSGVTLAKTFEVCTLGIIFCTNLVQFAREHLTFLRTIKKDNMINTFIVRMTKPPRRNPEFKLIFTNIRLNRIQVLDFAL